MSEPKISVIIPLYNAERFIRQCLISVLASKFTDYEVLVVDDCSTDNSVAEVKKLLPHFDGRLRILSTEKNSGGAGIPRNVGIKNSVGKYVTFIDNDDMIMPTALENFFEVAEFYAADVVYAEKHFIFRGNNFDGKNLELNFCGEMADLVDVPTPESDDLRERIRRDMEGKFFILPWGKLYRRDFLLENKIDFPQMRLSEDLTFCFKCLCLAKKYIRIPYVTNIRRLGRISASVFLCNSSQDGIRSWLKNSGKNINILDECMSELEFFRANPDVRFDVLKFYIDMHFKMILRLLRNAKPHEMQKIFFEELQNPALNPNVKNLVAAYLYAERVEKLKHDA